MTTHETEIESISKVSHLMGTDAQATTEGGWENRMPDKAQGRVTIDEIQKKVVQHYRIHLTDLSSAQRARAVVRPRQVAMFLAKQLTSRSLPEIGRKFGNRDHTTVMYAVSRVSELMEQDSTFADDVAVLRRLLEC